MRDHGSPVGAAGDPEINGADGVELDPLGAGVLRAAQLRPAVKWFLDLREFGHRASLDANRLKPAMLDWIRAWQRHTDTMRHDAAMIIACGTRRHGFDPALDLTSEELTSVTSPTLVLGGTDDPVGGRGTIERLAASLPNASGACLPGAGHLPWLDDPTWLAEHISAFVAA